MQRSPMLAISKCLSAFHKLSSKSAQRFSLTSVNHKIQNVRFYATVPEIGSSGVPAMLSIKDCEEVLKNAAAVLGSFMYVGQLSSVHSLPSVSDQWTAVQYFFVMARMDAMKQANIDPTKNPQLAQIFGQSLHRHLQTPEGAPLREIMKSTWEQIFSLAFKRKAPEDIPIPVLRRVISTVCETMVREENVKELHEVCSKYSDLQQKNRAVMLKIAEVMKEVGTKFGFVGEDGYLALQKNLADNGGDQFLLGQSTSLNVLIMEASDMNPYTMQPNPK